MDVTVDENNVVAQEQQLSVFFADVCVAAVGWEGGEEVGAQQLALRVRDDGGGVSACAPVGHYVLDGG